MSGTRATSGNEAELSRHHKIRVRGTIGPTLLQAFPTLTAHRHGQDTTLSGTLADPCALYGVIHQLEALGLDLLEIQSWPSTRQAPLPRQPAEERHAHDDPN